ncbi:ABC transporter substrate-binding protein [Hymenobacter translucens]|uniref:ABC transporter substrate-binding protein n=1 Tax=Hymenobacter translucens TaxID=2886507 RepID=UPI001D0DF24C|nr:ABC transporter substrate-binding protein [Hymenobacter translucens]
MLVVFAEASSCSSSPASRELPLRVRWIRDPETLDPLTQPNENARQGVNLLYQSLLTVDYEQQRFVPLLAESMPSVRHQGARTLITYRLRDSARWDDGQPVLARDVEFTLKVMNCPDLPNEEVRAQFGFITALQPDPLDSRRFTLVCEGAAPELVLASGDFPILPAHYLDPQNKLGAVPLAALQQDSLALRHYPDVAPFVQRYKAAQIGQHPDALPGSGPYRLASWKTGQQLEFRRKPRWWGQALQQTAPQLQARPEQIEFHVIPDDATALLAMRRADVDLYPRMPAREFGRLQADSARHPELSFYTAPSYDMTVAGFNTRSSLLAHRLTRQAISHLFDVPQLIQATQQGHAYRSVGLINPENKAFYNDSLRPFAFDPTEASRLLVRAGWQRTATGWERQRPGQSPQRLALRLSYRAGEPTYEAIGLQLRAAAAQLGIPITLHPTESSVLSGRLRAGEYDLYLRSMTGNPFVYNFAPILHTESIGSGNFTRFGTPDSDRLIKSITTEQNPQRKARLLRRLQALLQAECPLTVLYFNRYQIVAASRLANLQISGLPPGYNVMAITSRPDDSH